MSAARTGPSPSLGRARRARTPFVTLLALAALAGSGSAASADVDLATVNGKGEPLDRRSGLTAISGTGRYVTFTIDLGLQPGSTAPESDVWLYDRKRGRGERISGRPRDRGWHFDASVSASGRYVAFVSDSERLVKRKTDGGGRLNRQLDVFVHDRRRGRTQLVSRDRRRSDGRPGDRRNLSPVISADGRYVAFVSNSDNLGTGDEGLVRNRTHFVYVFDRRRKRTELVSKGAAGEIPDRDAWEPAISADGRYVSYYSAARNLAGDDGGRTSDVFRYDRAAGETELVSTGVAGTGPADGSSIGPDISADGERIAFQSVATDLVAEDADGELGDVFVRDLESGATELASGAEPGTGEGSDGEATAASISADGRFVSFASEATNLLDADGGLPQVYRRDLDRQVTELISASDGRPADDRASEPAISADGRFAAFVSRAGNLTRREGRRADVFLRDMGAR